MAEVSPDQSDTKDPVLEQFIELRKYIEHSHDGLSKRIDGLSGRIDGLSGGLDGLSGRVDELSGRVEKVEAGQRRLERKIDAGFDRVGRKIDGLGSLRQVARRRRKR